MEQTLRVGVITSTHGIRGEVKVFPTTDDPKRFDYLEEVIVDMKREPVKLEIEGVKYFKQFVILKFKGYDNINDIQQFVKKDLLVVTDEGVELGVLKDIMQTGANDVYVVGMNDGKEVLIPSIPQCILEKNPEEGYIRVHLLKGLLD